MYYIKNWDKMYKICLRNVTLGTHEPLYNNVRFGLSMSVCYSEKCEQAQLKMHKRIMAVYEFHHKHVIVLSPPE